MKTWDEPCPNCNQPIDDIWGLMSSTEKRKMDTHMDIWCPRCNEKLHITSIGNSRYGLGFSWETVSQTVRRLGSHERRYQMITILNFSHPILPGRPDIEDVLGDEYQVLEIKVHLDLAAPMVSQVIDIVGQAKARVRGNIRNIDCIVLPGLADAAALVIEEFRLAGYVPNILRLVRVPDTLPPRFEAVEVIHLRQPRHSDWEGEEGSFGPPDANTTPAI